MDISRLSLCTEYYGEVLSWDREVAALARGPGRRDSLSSDPEDTR